MHPINYDLTLLTLRGALLFASVVVFVHLGAKDYPVAAHSSFLTADSRSNWMAFIS
jgi:hypothetical protein